MARKGREGIAKRARERKRQERRKAKREQKRAAAAAAAEAEPTEGPDEDALMEEFRVLSERHAAGEVAEDLYNEERHRIYVELGIESEEPA